MSTRARAPKVRFAGPVMYVIRPYRPARVSKRLAELAESNPTPEQFDRVKARILEEEAA